MTYSATPKLLIRSKLGVSLAHIISTSFILSVISMELASIFFPHFEHSQIREILPLRELTFNDVSQSLENSGCPKQV